MEDLAVVMEDDLQVVTSNGTQGAAFMVAQMLSEVKRKWKVWPPVKDKDGKYAFHLQGRTKAAVGNWWVRDGDVVIFDPHYGSVRVMRPAPTLAEEEALKKDNGLGNTEDDLTEAQLRYINSVAPEHSRTSCEEGKTPRYNAWYGKDDVLFGRCTRCTLVNAALGDPEPKDDED